MAVSIIISCHGDRKMQENRALYDERILSNPYTSNPQNYPEMIGMKGFDIDSLRISDDAFPEDVQKIIKAFQKNPHKMMFPAYNEDNSLKRTELQLATFSKQGSLLAGKIGLVLARYMYPCKAVKLNRLVDIIFESNRYQKEESLGFGEGIHANYEIADFLFIDNFESFSDLTVPKKLAVEAFIDKRLSLGLVNHINFRLTQDEFLKNAELASTWGELLAKRFVIRVFEVDTSVLEQDNFFDELED